jgi:sugar phosphate isomerase/epimerase
VYTRRELGKLALGCLPSGLLFQSAMRGSPSRTPDSKWAGVQVGLNVPYSFGTRTAMRAEDVLERCIQLGVSGVELRAQPVEKSMGLPDKIVLGPAPVDYSAVYTPFGDVPGMPQHGGGHRPASPGAPAGASPSAGANGPASTPEGLAAYKAAAAELRQWRSSAPMSKANEIRKKYRDSGVEIDIVKFDGLGDLPDDELDYAFTLAKTLGARAVSGELWMPGVKRIAQAADRHKIMAGLHGHIAVTPAIWEQCFSYGKFVGANVDIGHFVAGSNTSPLPFITQHHERITHIHVKDRKKNDGPNVPFGQGDTPVKEVLQAIRNNRWPIPAIIEFEIPLAAGADRTKEIEECLDYCKQSLLG